MVDINRYIDQEIEKKHTERESERERDGDGDGD